MRYSLSRYILTIAIPAKLGFGSKTLSVGGEASYLDSITISFNNALWSTTGDATGSWVHTKNLDRTGTVTVSLSQLANNVSQFKTLCSTYFNAESDYDGLTLTLKDIDGNEIASCEDCYITKIPDQGFQSTAQQQSWTFTCGKITFN